LLLALFLFERGKHFDGTLLGIFAGDDADGARGSHIDESGGHFSPVQKFESSLAEAAIGDESDGVRHAAIDFDVSDDALLFADGVFDAELAETEHGEAHAEDLSGADVAVGDGGVFEVLVEGFHFGCWVIIGRIQVGRGCAASRVKVLRWYWLGLWRCGDG